MLLLRNYQSPGFHTWQQFRRTPLFWVGILLKKSAPATAEKVWLSFKESRERHDLQRHERNMKTRRLWNCLWKSCWIPLWILLWVLIYLRKLGDPNKTLCVWRVSSGFASLSNGLDTKLSIGHGNIVKLLLLSIILQIEAPSELCMFFLLGTQFLFICVYFLCIFVGWRLPHEPLVCIKVLHMWDSMPSCCQRGSDRCSSPQGPCF